MKSIDDQGVWCPVSGCLVSLDHVLDPMFKEEMLGTTICINPEDSMIYAPFDGTITVMYPSSHAVGIVRADGLEVLIHVGIDTVELNGAGFHGQVKQGDTVKRNSPLLAFDAQMIQGNGYSLQTFIVFTNSKQYHIKQKPTGEKIKIKDVLCYAEKL